MNTTEYNDYVVSQWDRHGSGKVRTPAEQLMIMSTGLAGEVGETLEHVKKFVRDQKPVGEAFALECGDALHYLTRLANHFGFTLQQVIDMNVAKLDARHGGRR